MVIKMKSSGIGGQAVLEGVMMRNKSKYAVAVRKPDGEIDIKVDTCTSEGDRKLFFRLPLIRGVVAFVDSLVLGMKTLTYSASFYEEEESQEASAADGNKADRTDEKSGEKQKKEGSEAESSASLAKKAEKREDGDGDDSNAVYCTGAGGVCCTSVWIIFAAKRSYSIAGCISTDRGTDPTGAVYRLCVCHFLYAGY